MSAPDRGATRDMGDASGGGSGPPGAGAVGGAEGSPRGVSARMQKIKKSLKDLPQDDSEYRLKVCVCVCVVLCGVVWCVCVLWCDVCVCVVWCSVCGVAWCLCVCCTWCGCP